MFHPIMSAGNFRGKGNLRLVDRRFQQRYNYKLTLKMDHETDSSKKKDKLKIIKDLSFLHQIQPTIVNQNCAKYLLAEGEGDALQDLEENFQIIYSLKQYDYQGKRMNQYSEGKLPKFGKNNELTSLLLTMKIKEKAWFNCCQEKIFNKGKSTEVFEDIEIIEQEDLNDEPGTESVVQDEEDHFYRTGCHYQLYVIRIQYKNKEDIQTKRKIFAQKKQEAKVKFTAKEYLEAAKIYKFLDSITSGYSKKVFTQENTIELDSMNQNSKVNYLKCFFKMVEANANIPEEINTHAATAIEFLLKHTHDDPVVHFLNAKWLLKERYLDQSFKEAQRSYKIKATPEAHQLMLLIKQQKEKKGKIKVAVQEPQKK